MVSPECLGDRCVNQVQSPAPVGTTDVTQPQHCDERTQGLRGGFLGTFGAIRERTGHAPRTGDGDEDSDPLVEPRVRSTSVEQRGCERGSAEDAPSSECVGTLLGNGTRRVQSRTQQDSTDEPRGQACEEMCELRRIGARSRLEIARCMQRGDREGGERQCNAQINGARPRQEQAPGNDDAHPGEVDGNQWAAGQARQDEQSYGGSNREVGKGVIARRRTGKSRQWSQRPTNQERGVFL
jgi:hypothetical protein